MQFLGFCLTFRYVSCFGFGNGRALSLSDLSCLLVTMENSGMDGYRSDAEAGLFIA